MKIATWNINGIKARIETVLSWLDQASPDIVFFQEIKSVDENFPREAFNERGYGVETHGQKGFNGVAVLSKHPIQAVKRGLPGDENDEQARYIEADFTVDDTELTIGGLYLPNGNPAPGEKFDYKLRWFERLEARAAQLLGSERPTLLMGDYNVIPQAEDCFDPDAWADDALFRPESRRAFRALMAQGWTDAVRTAYPSGVHYTFWDYQAGCWPRDRGIRIDHILMSPQAADLLASVEIDRETRGWEKPSDHVPVICTLAL